MFSDDVLDRTWLPVDYAADRLGVTPDAVIEAVRDGTLRWTVRGDGRLLVEPAIITRHGPA
jgi:hypothetical protein